MTMIETDARSRVVLPGRPNEKFLLRENDDGSIVLEPVRVISDAQREYDDSPELRHLLAKAVESCTVKRSRNRVT